MGGVETGTGLYSAKEGTIRGNPIALKAIPDASFPEEKEAKWRR